MLRIPSSQPPIEVTMMLRAGRIACWTAEAMNGPFEADREAALVS